MAHTVRDNAAGLVDDAKVLLEAKRFARAFALGELAAEEVGKLILVSATAVRVAVGMEVDWRRFWEHFRHHPPKAWNVSLIDRIMAVNAQAWTDGNVDAIMADAEGIKEARLQAKALPHAKNDAIYVDHRGGRLRNPSEVITEDQARTIVTGVERLLVALQARGFPPGRGLLPRAAANPAFRRRFRPVAERFASVDRQQESKS